MAINRQKLKLLYLMRMLEEETDAERGLTMAQIDREAGSAGAVSAERKSIYRDIEALREFGVDVRTYQRAPVEYAVEHRAFAFAELQLLVDAVQSSRFLTQRKSDALVEGVKQLASRRQRALLDKRVHVEGRIKMQNESVFGSVDRIQEAIALKRRISFVYFKYDAAKRKALQHNGERYIETPVQLVYAEGYYYLVVFNEKHDDFANYRVDRMDRIEVLDEPAIKNERIATFDARELESRAFGMYSGEPVAATLLVDEEIMGAVIDRFGKDVESVPTGEKQARVYATVMKSPVLFGGWLSSAAASASRSRPRWRRSTAPTLRTSSPRTSRAPPFQRLGCPRASHRLRHRLFIVLAGGSAAADDQSASVVEDDLQFHEQPVLVGAEHKIAHLPSDGVRAGA